MGDDADEFVRDMKRMNRRVTREDEARSRRMEADLERERSRRSAPIRREDDPLYSEKGSIGASFRKHTFGDQKPQKPLLSVFFKSDKKGAQDDLRGGGSGGPRDSRRRRGGGSGNWDDLDSPHPSSRPRPSSRYEDDDYYEEEREVRRSPRRSHRAEDEDSEVTTRTRRGGPASTRHEPPRSRMRDEQAEEAAQEEERRRERRAEAEKKAAEEGRIARPSGRYADEEEIEARPRRPRPARNEPDYEEEETVTRRSRPARPGGRDDVEEVSTRRKTRPRREDLNNGAEEEDEGEAVRRRRRQRTPTRDDEVDYETEVAPRNARSPRPRAGDETVETVRHRRARPDRADPAHDVEEEEYIERRQRPASDLPPRPPRRSGGGHDEDEYAEASRHRPRTRPPVDDYEEVERVSTRSTNSSHRSAEEPPRRSRLEPELRPARGERVRRLKEVQTEHRKKVESDAALAPDYYEEEEVEVSRRPEPHLPSRASRPTPAVPHRNYELSDEDEAAPSSLPASRALETDADDAAPQFRLPQPVSRPHHTETTPRRSLVQSAQRVSPLDEAEEEAVIKEPKKPYVRPRLGTPSGPDEEVERIAPKISPKVPQKSSIKPKPRTVLPKEEEDDDAAFLSAARSKLRGPQVSHVPKPPPSRGTRSQSPESEDEFVPPKLKPATVRKVSEAKPSEAIRKLAELRATKPVLKVEERTPEALQQRAALRPSKPVTKASVSKPEAAEVLSRLKPRSSVSHDDTDPRAEALAAQLRQLKPRSSFQDSSDDELEPRAPSRTDSMDSVDSLHHPTKGRSKGPRRRLPTQ